MKNGIFIILFVWFIELAIKIESKKTPVILTSKGPVQGEVLKTAINFIPYSAFKGVPYAEPPLGYLRFKPPIEKKPWTNVLSTTVEGAVCTQKNFVDFTEYIGSEDCLYLNVYTPMLQFNSNKSDLLSVMVWICGGGFDTGFGNSSLYGPDYIIEDNAILVTFNYRLGPLGFLNLDHENATGNAALKDQNLVLCWVKENIEKFGGDPNNVTIFGESAGAVSVDLHMLSDLSRGLFHRAIAMSGSPLCPWGFHSREAAVAQAFVLGKKLGIVTTSTDELLKALYKASARDIMEKAHGMGGTNPPFKPTVESASVGLHKKKFLTEYPYKKYISNNFSKVPYMTGFTSNETLLFAQSLDEFSDMVTFATNVFKLCLSNFPISLPLATNILDALTNGVKSLSDYAINKVVEETSDILFIVGIDYKRRLLQSRTEYSVYLYRFAYQSDDSLHKQLYGVRINGTAHIDDLGYLFHMIVANQSKDPENPSFITRQRMVRLWTNFAKYGNPTPAGKQDNLLQGITWPSAQNSNCYLDFKDNLSIRQNPIDATAYFIELVDLVYLPVQSGCVTDFIKEITNLNSLINKAKYVANTIKNSTKTIFSRLPVIGRI